MWQFLFLQNVIRNIICKVIPSVVACAVYTEVDNKTKTLCFKIILFVMSCHIICSNRTKRISNYVGTNPFSNITYFKTANKTLKQHYSVTINVDFVLDNNR